MTDLVLYFDGASRGNPGPSGAGCYIITEPPSDINIELKKALGRKTNNQAEYMGLIIGLKHILEIMSTKKFASLTIMGDSNLVVQQIRGNWRVKSENIRALYRETMNLLQELQKEGVRYTITHVRRNLNSKADALANQALDG